MRKILPLLLLFLSVNELIGQDFNIPGRLSGSFESINQVYRKDTIIDALLPQDKVGSNNYLKLDYSFKKLSAGLQAESYLPSLAGYPVVLNGTNLINRYFKYNDEKFSVLVGDFYEQFGNGLIFRAWENRQIGINNAVEGVSIQATPFSFLKIKTIYGKQRKGFERTSSNIRGIDALIDFSQIGTGEKERLLSTQMGLSYVTRYQEYTGPETEFPSTVNAFSARMDFFHPFAGLSVEFVYKSKDPQVDNLFSTVNGEALLVNSSLTFDRIGINMNFRSLKNMCFRGERDATGVIAPVNYIPALTRQHEYLVTNMYIYNPQPVGELGGQADIFINTGDAGTALGHYGSDIAINFSWYGGLNPRAGLFAYTTDYFRDASIEWKKKWSKKIRTVFQAQYLFYNKSVIEGGNYENITAGTFVMGTLYNITAKSALNIELQHLNTRQDHGNWAALLCEYSLAPKWSFFVSDLYNYGKTDLHYPSFGGGFSSGTTRFGISYGRQRAGLFCAGGVCRYVPASTGFTITLSTTFN